MEIFEQFFSETPKKVSLHERKLFLPNETNILLYGAPKCGKTSLAILHATKKKEPYIYIDFKDLRMEGRHFDIAYNFAASKKLSTVIFDGYGGEEFVARKEMQTILISDREYEIEDFAPNRLTGIDFEEYISFEDSAKKDNEFEDDAVAHIFANFIKDGSLPKISELTEFEKHRYKTELIKTIATNQTEEMIIVEFLRKTGMKFSLLQVFTALKSKIKISKDFFYSYTQKLESIGILFFVEKLHQKNSPKKIYSYDFTLKTTADLKKDFSGIFENMVFLELNSRGYELFYTDEAGLFVPEIEKAVVAKPFMPADEDKMMAKLAKKAEELGIRSVEIITVNKEAEITIGSVHIQTTPFWQWALSF